MGVEPINIDYQPNNYNEKLGLFEWQIREAFKRWKNKSELEDLIGFKLD
ncbi:unnamed protein product [marine sediment metagenome]|uniref:Uncharacterized protein n=1 Tax=marine sediment metagenome TaxID=412755 RepID=X1C4I5_9ZZZZ